jgi:hypothetical protein
MFTVFYNSISLLLVCNLMYTALQILISITFYIKKYILQLEKLLLSN